MSDSFGEGKCECEDCKEDASARLSVFVCNKHLKKFQEKATKLRDEYNSGELNDRRKDV